MKTREKLLVGAFIFTVLGATIAINANQIKDSLKSDATIVEQNMDEYKAIDKKEVELALDAE